MGRAWGDVARGAGYEDQFFRRSLEDYPGIVVEHFDFMAKLAQRGREDMSQLLWRRVVETRPDMVFLVPFAPWAGPLGQIVRQITESTSSKTVLWVCDDPWQFGEFSCKWAPCVDHIITTDPGMVSNYQAIGCKHRLILSQWGVDTDLYSPQDVEQDIDVSFVGHAHSNRRAIIADLRAKGIRVEVFGRGWGGQNDRLSDAEMIDVFRRSKINLNLDLSIDASCQQIKARNFEVTACGGFLLTGRVPYLDRYFVDREELVMFDHVGELPDLIGHYLARLGDRVRISQLGARRSHRDHSWRSRFASIFEQLEFSPLSRNSTADAELGVQLGV